MLGDFICGLSTDYCLGPWAIDCIMQHCAMPDPWSKMKCELFGISAYAGAFFNAKIYDHGPSELSAAWA